MRVSVGNEIVLVNALFISISVYLILSQYLIPCSPLSLRQLYEVAIQAAIGKKIIARET